jgi:transposase InsO family protein
VGEGGDEMSVARFVADQRALYRVPIAFCCRVLGISVSWFYKWIKRPAKRPVTGREQRRAELDEKVKDAFEVKGGTAGSPKLVEDLRDAGLGVSKNTVAESMARQGLVARNTRKKKGLTRQDRTKPKFPDLLKRDFTAGRINCKWVGDMTEIPTREGKLYLATVIDLYSRRLIGMATGRHPDAQLACDAINTAIACRGGREAIWKDDLSERVIFHTDRGSTYTANSFTKLCAKLGIRQSMGKVGSCFDNAAAESFFSSLEWEVLSKHQFQTIKQARAAVTDWCWGFYNHERRHATNGLISPIQYETQNAVWKEAA